MLLFKIQAELRNLKMIIDYEDGLFYIINNDPDRIRQMLIHLLRNSFKTQFSPEGIETTKVRFSTELMDSQLSSIIESFINK